MGASALPSSSSSSLLGRTIPTHNVRKCSQQSVVCKVSAPRASIEQSQQQSAVTRRDAMLLTSAASAALVLPPSALAAATIGAPKGYAGLEDSQDRYRFFYPFGWQEVQVKGQDVVFKDVIEPLENVSVNVINTDKKDVKELGPAESVAQILVDKVLTGPTQQAKLISVQEKESEGKNYVVFEFVAAAPSYKRHALGVITVANGKFYTLTTGSNERRWRAMEEKLKAVVNSFQAI